MQVCIHIYVHIWVTKWVTVLSPCLYCVRVPRCACIYIYKYIYIYIYQCTCLYVCVWRENSTLLILFGTKRLLLTYWHIKSILTQPFHVKSGKILVGIKLTIFVKLILCNWQLYITILFLSNSVTFNKKKLCASTDFTDGKSILVEVMA